MEMLITFPGGKRVNAEVKGHLIETDQPPALGGDGTAPEPFTLFLASIGTCAGVYVQGFCQNRDLPTENIKLVQRSEFDSESGALLSVSIEIQVPPDFPRKYHDALVRVAGKCAVKRAIFNPPDFSFQTTVV